MFCAMLLDESPSSKPKEISLKNQTNQESSAANKLQFLHPSAGFLSSPRKVQAQLSPAAVLFLSGEMGKKKIQVWRSVATRWEDAMSFEFPLFCFHYRSRVLVHLFFSEVCSRCSSLFGKTFSIMMDFHPVRRWITKSVRPAGRNHFRMASACFPIVTNQRFTFPLSVAIVISSHVFPSDCPFLHFQRRSKTHQPSIHPTSLFLFSSLFLFNIFCCWPSRCFMAFCSDLASFPQSK